VSFGPNDAVPCLRRLESSVTPANREIKQTASLSAIITRRKVYNCSKGVPFIMI
jgi:hypothetical protein